MSRIIAYLTFNGNCKEAMEFYQSCLGGQLKYLSIEDSLKKKNTLPKTISEKIITALLTKENFTIMGYNLAGEGKLVIGNSDSILIECETQSEINNYYKKLTKNCKASFKSNNSKDIVISTVKDKFSNNWLLYCSKN